MFSIHKAPSSGWTPIALSRDVPTGSATDTMLRGADLALWRAHNGLIHAWVNRCPHRGMRLSLGFVRENRLVCLYHGWEYASTGGCRHIPAHPDLDPPTSIRAERYHAAERYGMVWLDGRTGSTRDAAEYVAEMPPEYPVTPVCSVYIDTPVSQVLDTLAARTDNMQCADNLVHATVEGSDLVIGIQVCNDTTTAMHICLGAVGYSSARLRRFTLWAQQFRDEMHEYRAVAS